MIKSVYIHIPFCKNICSYCDFAKIHYFKNWVQDYLVELEKEIRKKYNGNIINTIYIGGGTPNCLSTEELEKLFKIINIFDLSKNIEFTIECNIEDLSEDKLEVLKKNGVNRISLGVQTMNLKYLKFCNRKHTPEMVKKWIKLIKTSYIENINIDLIYGFPKQTLKELKKDIHDFIQLDISHISTYSLMIEPHTLLFNEKVSTIKEEIDFKMYQLIENTLKQSGYQHYEISNYKKEEYQSKHNLTYWNNEYYYGFGLGASSYLPKKRSTNTRNFHTYLKGIYTEFEEIIDVDKQLSYEFILGFRKLEGINKEKFYQKYQISLIEYPVIKQLLEKGDLIENERFVYIPPEKMYISNEVLWHFV